MNNTKHHHNTVHNISQLPLLDRDESWMYFNHRILQEACRPEVPLLERLSFLGIYSNNLDEFFRVRMATQARLGELSGKGVAEEARHARELFGRLSALDDTYTRQYEEAIKTLSSDLAANNIRILRPEELSDEQAHFVRCKFRKDVSGFVSPVWLSRFRGFTTETDDHIYLGVALSGESVHDELAIIELPSKQCGRFVRLPDKDGSVCIMYLDDVIRFCLPMIFPGMGYDSFKAYSFKFTKDAELELDSDLQHGLLQKVAKAVKTRKRGAALRVLYDSDMPGNMLGAIMKKLHLDRLDTVKPSGRYHNHKDFMAFPDINRPDLKYDQWIPIVADELKHTGSLIEAVWEKDRFVHVPYHTFDYVVRLLQEAAVSKNVKSIKISLYRVAKESKIVKALINAANNGKKVTVMVELLARFDESSNIGIAKKLQDAGINVIFGVEGLKVHSKIVHIGMKKGRDIAIIGTGNFHEGNAKVYTDYFMMTARKDLVKGVAGVFDFLKKPYQPPQTGKLLVSPLSMRKKFIDLIDDEIAAAKKGQEASIKIKINHITDPEMSRKLYEAAAEGVDVQLLVRGNFSIYPEEPALKGNMKAVGIIDRYLEHSRIFIFHAGGKKKIFLGSADWMPRNLDHRVEVVTPVEDPDLKADLINTVETGLNDNVKGRKIDGKGLNIIQQNELPPLRSQEALYNHYLREC